MRAFGKAAGAGAVLVMVLASMAPAARAQPAADIPWMTGASLVKKLGSVDPRTIHWTRDSPFPSAAVAAGFQDMVNGEFVQGYVSALRDATEGKEWCWSPYRPKPHILLDDATRALQKMSDAQLKRSAADLIVEHWRAKFPCSGEAARRKE